MWQMNESYLLISCIATHFPSVKLYNFNLQLFSCRKHFSINLFNTIGLNLQFRHTLLTNRKRLVDCKYYSTTIRNKDKDFVCPDFICYYNLTGF